MRFDRYLLAYFVNGTDPAAEQIRFAISADDTPLRWIALNGGAPVLRSDVGERGARDPFLVRDPLGNRFILLATDLHAAVDGDWHRAVRNGSRSILLWSSADLLTWTPPRLVAVAPRVAGNAWAPKAFWDRDRGVWRVFFASAIYSPGSDRAEEAHQRVYVTDTDDFSSFSEARVYLDRGHDVIDVTFLESEGMTLRFTVDARSTIPAEKWRFVTQECGDSMFESRFSPVRHDLGRGALQHAEGPAPFPALDGSGAYLLLDEFEARGYQLFHSPHPGEGTWTHISEAKLPFGARHGSVLPITAAEADRLLNAGDMS